MLNRYLFLSLSPLSLSFSISRYISLSLSLSRYLSLSLYPSEGSNLTPAHHYPDFRFKTYAPVAFRYFRELFGIRPDDYLVRVQLTHSVAHVPRQIPACQYSTKPPPPQPPEINDAKHETHTHTHTHTQTHSSHMLSGVPGGFLSTCSLSAESPPPQCCPHPACTVKRLAVRSLLGRLSKPSWGG